MINFRITIEGTAPLLMHNGRLANPLDPAAKAIKRVSGKRQKTDADYEEVARLDHMGALYLDPDVGPYLPSDNIWKTLHKAAMKSKKGKKVEEGVFISSDVNPLAYRGPRDADGLWADENFRHLSTVVISRSRVPRCRPIFREWRVDADGILDPNVLELTELRDIATIAGQLIGLGDWRPRYGRFVATVEAVK
jgi:hypothetical protein